MSERSHPFDGADDDVDDDPDSEDRRDLTCRSCGGDGMEDDCMPCPDCDGEGYQWWLA